jgi:small subunit ribosomal protein S4
MGDPKKSRKKYSKPVHPWMKGRIDEERILRKEYGFKNKKELWKVNSLLKSFYARAKKYVASNAPQSVKEQKQMIEKLKALGLVQGDATLDQILSIQLKDLMERRLQTLVCRKGLTRTVKQARQFIVHGHIKVAGKVITSPSYLVPLKEEGSIVFSENSQLSKEDHPERAIVPKEKKPEKKPEEKKGRREGPRRR